MSKKADINLVEKARADLEALRAQRDKRVADLNADELRLGSSSLGLGDVLRFLRSASMSDPQRRELDLLDAKSVELDALAADISAAELKLGAALAEQKKQQTVELRNAEFDAYKAVIPVLKDLQKKLDRLADIQQSLMRQYDAHPKHVFPGLPQACGRAERWVADQTPDLLGLPKKPSADELRERELADRIERQEARLYALRQQYSEGGNWPLAIKNEIKKVIDDLKRLNPDGDYKPGQYEL